jgi:hypothetical protein
MNSFKGLVFMKRKCILVFMKGKCILVFMKGKCIPAFDINVNVNIVKSYWLKFLKS